MRFAWASSAASPSRSFDRRAVDPDLLKEYDAFGPWIGEVRSAQDLPRRFRAHHAATAGARYLLKIPVDRDRRTIVPGEDLYRSVLAVHEDHLRRLELDGDSVRETRVELPDIVAIANDTFLLLGVVRLHLAGGGTFEVPYNTTSQPLVNGVIDFLRGRVSPGPAAGRREPGRPAVADYYLGNLVAEQERRTGPCTIVHCEEQGPTLTDASGRKRKATGLLALRSGAELTFMVAGKVAGKDGDLSYALDRAYLPQRALRAHEVCEVRLRWGRTRRVLRLRLAGGHVLELPLRGGGGALPALLEQLEAGQAREPTHPAA
jgi:hypothetical protein